MKVNSHVIKRSILINSTYEVTHYHFVSWKDFGVPTGNSLTAFQELIKDTRVFLQQAHCSNSQDKLVVHCKAGIGRTGTTIALINAAITLNETGDKVSPFSIVRRLREQRI